MAGISSFIGTAPFGPIPIGGNESGGGGPPFPANSADNGLSVDPISGKIVLGQSLGEIGDPSQFLDAREIVMAGHPLTMRNAGNLQLNIHPGLGIYQIGDINNAAFGTSIKIDDPNKTVRIERTAELMLFLTPQVYSLGNVNDTLLGSKISIDDANESLIFRSLARGRMMDVAGFNKLYRIGDIESLGNGNALIIDDDNRSISLGDTGIVGNGMVLQVIDVAQIVSMGDQAGTSRITIDAGGSQGSVLANNGWNIVSTDGILLHFTNALTNGAGASLGTLTNAPAAGPPTKWVPFDDGGVIRHFPAW